MIVEDKLHPFLLKKIRREIIGTQSILHLSDKQEQITESFAAANSYAKFVSLDALRRQLDVNSAAAFSHLIVDLDLACCDDFDRFLIEIKKLMSPNALLVVIATNLCTWRNKINFWFGNDLESISRPYRAVAPRFLRDKLLANNFKVKNRFWDYGDKILIIANL